MHSVSWFVTLTYDDAHLPSNGSLRKRDWQLFMMRFRKEYGPCRYFMCGQYGERSLRPHYHALLFGVDLPDKRLYSKVAGNILWRSEKLDRVWGQGDVKFSVLSPETVNYVTAYMNRSSLDKWNCERAGLEPEFQLMSRKPGIGAKWYERFKGDVYPEDSVTVAGGGKLRPPRYYDELLKKEDPALLEKLKVRRRLAQESNPDVEPRQLIVREELHMRREKFFSGSDPEG